MVQSVLIQLYLNMSVVYMRNGFYDLAKSVIEECMSYNPNSCVIHFRKAQTIAYNAESTIEELEEAQKMMILATNMKRYEKLFNSAEGILVILGY